jgi:hypothetical protein
VPPLTLEGFAEKKAPSGFGKLGNFPFGAFMEHRKGDRKGVIGDRKGFTRDRKGSEWKAAPNRKHPFETQPP